MHLVQYEPLGTTDSTKLPLQTLRNTLSPLGRIRNLLHGVLQLYVLHLRQFSVFVKNINGMDKASSNVDGHTDGHAQVKAFRRQSVEEAK